MKTFIVALTFFLMFIGTTTNRTNADDEGAASLKNRYKMLEQRYHALQQLGIDLSSTRALIEEIKTDRRQRDLSSLPQHLDEFETMLDKLSASSGSKRSPNLLSHSNSPSPFTGGGLPSLLAGLANSEGYNRLLRYRGHARIIAANGAAGRNRRKFSDVAAQRDALWVLARAYATGDSELVDAVAQAMEFAFGHFSPDGYFHNGLGLSPRKAISGDVFFLQSFARAYFMLNGTELGRGRIERLAALRPKLGKALEWLSRNTDELYRQDRNAANRLVFDGLAFLLNGLILEKPSYIETGKAFLKHALASQDASGAFREHGGGDTSYQAVSILNLVVAWIVLPQDSSLRTTIYDALVRAVRWELERIAPNGKVSVAENTRTGKRQEKFFGKPKDVNYAEVALALFYWSSISGDLEAAMKATKVIDYALEKHGYD